MENKTVTDVSRGQNHEGPGGPWVGAWSGAGSESSELFPGTPAPQLRWETQVSQV